MKLFRGKQKGFSLIELLVAIPIAGLVVAAATGAIIQLLNVSDINANTMAIRQVQTAGSWVSRDGVQAQSTSGISTVGTGMPFTLTWSFWDTGASPPVNETHQVTYSLVDMPSGSLKQVQRHEIVTDANGAVTSDTTIFVAKYVDGSAISCQWAWETDPAPAHYSSTTFIFTVTAAVGSETESRSYQIRPRSLV